ncbi:MAG: hypothetical protein H5T86_03115 [Armatimonadetes bacterium]|nr:hypothetical protein [Armatimonadota bacterium]
MGNVLIQYEPDGAAQREVVTWLLPAYAVKPLASDAAMTFVPALEEASSVAVEVWPATTARDRAEVVAFAAYCEVGGTLVSQCYPISTSAVHRAVNDIWSSLSAARGQAQRAVYRIVSDGDSEPSYRFTFTRPATRNLEELLDYCAAVGSPRTVTPLIVVDYGVLAEISEHYKAHRAEETMGSLHGQPYYCPQLRVIWVHVTSFTPLPSAEASVSSVRIAADGLTAAMSRVAKGDRLVGLIHSHIIDDPSQRLTAATSETDISVMCQKLPYAYQFSMMVNVVTSTGDLACGQLCWQRGNVVYRSGFLVLQRDRQEADLPIAAACEELGEDDFGGAEQ